MKWDSPNSIMTNFALGLLLQKFSLTELISEAFFVSCEPRTVWMKPDIRETGPLTLRPVYFCLSFIDIAVSLTGLKSRDPFKSRVS